MLHYNLIASQLRMIWDDVRCSTYAKAISKMIKKDDIVIDFGAGLGIWSMLAVRAGAARVYAIERNADIARIAEALILENGFLDRIHLITADAGSIELPEKADCLISELMTTSGFNEYDGNSLMKIRDFFLKNKKNMLPSRIRHYIRLCDFTEAFKSSDKKWVNGTWADDLYGLSWKSALPFATASLSCTNICKYEWASDGVVWWDLNLLLDSFSDNQNHSGEINWKVKRTGNCHGAITYFEADLEDGIVLSTSPDAPLTHWKHAFLSFPRPLKLRRGDIVEGRFGYSAAYGLEAYPLSITQRRGDRVCDSFSTYPSTIPFTKKWSLQGSQEQMS